MKQKLWVARQISCLLFTLLILMSPPVNGAPPTNANIVTGHVTDENASPIEGVSVTVKGSQTGTTTKADGSYSVSVNPGQTLVFSSVGYETVERKYNGQATINVQLKIISTRSGEVVVAIGYGTIKKKDVTGAVTSIKAEEFNKGAVVNPMGLIQGKVPGLSITRTSGGNPNGDYQILLRGLNTLSGGKAPLIIVDGIVGTNTLAMLDPNEIESIDVLKDGSAASIYGTRATNGVILITTKRAKTGTVSYEFRSYVNTERIAEETRFFTPEEYRTTLTKYYPGYASVLDAGQSTDWLNEVTRKPIGQYYSFSATGGTSALSFRANLYYKDDEGILKNSGATTVTPSIFISSTGLDGRLKIDSRLFYSNIKRKGGNSNAIFQAVVRNPTQPVYDSADVAHGGYYTDNTSSGQLNPVAMINESNNDITDQFFAGDVLTSYKLSSAFKANLHYSFNAHQRNSAAYQTRFFPELGTNGNTTISSSSDGDMLFEPGFEFNKHVNDHSIQAIGGYSYYEYKNQGLSMNNYDFPVESFSYNNIGAGAALGLGLASMDNYKASNKLISFYSRALYNYKQKYLLSLSGRYEGSSRFGINNKWGFFPAISAGWRISEEEFAKNISWLNALKLRAGYGVTGNQDIPNYQSISRISTTNRLFYYNGQWLNSYAPSSNPNPDLKWEKKGEFDVGVDFSLFQSRLSGTFDFYNRRISDLLWNYTVPVPPNVYPTTYANVGVIRNQGIEFSLTAAIAQSSNFHWESTVLYSANKNKLLSFSDAPRGYKLDYLQVNPVNGTWSQLILEGQPIGNFVAPVYLGLDANGMPVYKDVNGDGKIDVASQEDREIVGNAYPKFSLGWTNQLRYKNLDLSIFFRGVFGHSLVNYERALYENWKSFLNSRNVVRSILDNPDYKGDNTYDSRYVEKASYIKLDNLTLGYTAKIRGLKQVRLYATCQNLFTLTNYKGVDPEVSISNFDLRPAVNGAENLNYYPYTITFLLGLDVNF